MAAAKKTTRAALPAKPRPQGKAQRWMAAHLDMKQQRVSQFVTEGIFPALPDGTLDPDVCRVIYIRWLRDESRKSTAAAQTSRAQEMRAQEIELRLAKERREVMPVADVQEFLSDTVGAFRTELAGVAAASTRDPDQRAVINGNLNAALDRLRAQFDAGTAAFKDGQSATLGGEDPDA